MDALTVHTIASQFKDSFEGISVSGNKVLSHALSTALHICSIASFQLISDVHQ